MFITNGRNIAVLLCFFSLFRFTSSLEGSEPSARIPLQCRLDGFCCWPLRVKQAFLYDPAWRCTVKKNRETHVHWSAWSIRVSSVIRHRNPTQSNADRLTPYFEVAFSTSCAQSFRCRAERRVRANLTYRKSSIERIAKVRHVDCLSECMLSILIMNFKVKLKPHIRNAASKIESVGLVHLYSLHPRILLWDGIQTTWSFLAIFDPPHCGFTWFFERPPSPPRKNTWH